MLSSERRDAIPQYYSKCDMSAGRDAVRTMHIVVAAGRVIARPQSVCSPPNVHAMQARVPRPSIHLLHAVPSRSHNPLTALKVGALEPRSPVGGMN